MVDKLYTLYGMLSAQKMTFNVSLTYIVYWRAHVLCVLMVVWYIVVSVPCAYDSGRLARCKNSLSLASRFSPGFGGDCDAHLFSYLCFCSVFFYFLRPVYCVPNVAIVS